MQLMGGIAAALLVSAFGCSAAGACSLSISTGGTLALSADGTRLASTELGGGAAIVLVSNGLFDGAFDITVGAPTLEVSPPGFNTGSAVLAIAYSGSGGLGGASQQSYTSSQTSFHVGALALGNVALTINSRITSPGGFRAGAYKTKTVVTCS